MEIKYDVSITAIGNLARTFLENNNSAILLDEGIRPNLSDMVIEHTPGKLEEDIKKGDKLLMGGVSRKSAMLPTTTSVTKATARLSSTQRARCRDRSSSRDRPSRRSRLVLISPLLRNKDKSVAILAAK